MNRKEFPIKFHTLISSKLVYDIYTRKSLNSMYHYPQYIKSLPTVKVEYLLNKMDEFLTSPFWLKVFIPQLIKLDILLTPFRPNSNNIELCVQYDNLIKKLEYRYDKYAKLYAQSCKTIIDIVNTIDKMMFEYLFTCIMLNLKFEKELFADEVKDFNKKYNMTYFIDKSKTREEWASSIIIFRTIANNIDRFGFPYDMADFKKWL